MPEPASVITRAEWEAEAVRRFGPDPLNWRFVCPCCGNVASTTDWRDAGAPVDAVAFSCVGRWLPGARRAFGGSGPGPCDYTGGGLFKLNPVAVTTPDGKTHHVFAFAEPAPQPEPEPAAEPEPAPEPRHA
jgi:hypothetical protein